MAFDFEDDDSELDSFDESTLEHEGNDYSDSEDSGEVVFYTEEQFRARGVDPVRPTTAKPGSEAKVIMLAARYAAGLPLWHDKDCYDHGPHLAERVN